MNIPGANLLKIAERLISFPTVAYYPWVSRALNADGEYIDTYATAVNIKGSLQPVPRNLYDKFGLDYQNIYYTFYTSTHVEVLKRDVNGDKLTFDGKDYKCQSSNDWFARDGWTGVLCVQVN